MTILHLINGFGPGGAERSLVELIPRYAEMGIESRVIHLKDRDVGFQGEVEAMGCPVERLPGRRLSARVRALRSRLKARPPDLIHTTLFDADQVGRLAAWGTGVPVLTSLVSTSYDPVRRSDPHLNQRAFRLVRWFDGMTARHLTTHFHAITHAVRDSYVEALGLDPARITVVERGRSADRLGRRTAARRERVRRSLRVEAGQPVLLSVGRQEFQKGQRYLVEALPELVAARPDLVVWVAGRPGSESARLERRIVELGLSEQVRLLGHRPDVTDLMAAADVFVFPSLLEGLGGAVIEAMALELPVVASDLPVLREVLGTTGLFAAPADAGALAAAVRATLDAPSAAAERARQGRERFETRFTIERTAREMAALYRRLTTL